MKSMGRFFGGLLTVALMAFTLQSSAAETQQIGRNFNHLTTGFALSGGHAVAACESCHVGGVFKGTPRACDGCHAVGRRIVATPKNDKHIVTDAPCESCHFNTATWLGARFNHGSAIPDQCATCHNGRQATGRPAGHYTGGVKQTKNCDSCHRTSAWVVIGMWNHKPADVAGKTCNNAQCHAVGGEASAKAVTSNPRHLPWPSVGGANFTDCENCHQSKFTFTAVRYNHPTGLACDGCHNNTYNLGAVRGKPSNHIPDNGASCTSCHTTNYSWRGMDHSVVSTMECKTCHLKGTGYLGNMETKSLGHKGWKTGDCSQSGCHKPLGNKGKLYTNWE